MTGGVARLLPIKLSCLEEMEIRHFLKSLNPIGQEAVFLGRMSWPWHRLSFRVRVVINFLPPEIITSDY